MCEFVCVCVCVCLFAYVRLCVFFYVCEFVMVSHVDKARICSAEEWVNVCVCVCMYICM